MMKISPESVESERAWWNEALHALRVYVQADITEAERARKACRLGITPSAFALDLMRRLELSRVD